MKHAHLVRNLVLQVTDEPGALFGTSSVEITDEQATQIAALKAAGKKVQLVNGVLSEFPPKRLYTAEQWISLQLAPNAGQFIALRTQALQDFEIKLSQASKTSPKLQAIRSWINGIMGLYASDLQPRSDWASIPHTFEETVQEAAFVLNS